RVGLRVPPFRIRRAPFVDVDAKCGVLSHPSLNCLTSERPAAGLLPAVAGREGLHCWTFVLLLQPPQGGPPDVVIKCAENVLGSPRVAIEVTPASQHRVESPPAIGQAPSATPRSTVIRSTPAVRLPRFRPRARARI